MHELLLRCWLQNVLCESRQGASGRFDANECFVARRTMQGVLRDAVRGLVADHIDGDERAEEGTVAITVIEGSSVPKRIVISASVVDVAVHAIAVVVDTKPTEHVVVVAL